MAAPTSSASFARLTEQETMLSAVFVERAAPSVPADGRGARAVLEAILLEALQTRPCYVLFSGGRDSSALLAVAVHVARRTGLPLPVPVTAHHPAHSRSHEQQWQDLVLGHLDVSERVVVELDGEQRLLGDVATAAIRRHGVVWPEAVQGHGAIYRHLDAAGAVVHGEGGDNVISGGRAAWVRALGTRRPDRALLRGAIRAAVPVTARRARRGAEPWPWLTAAGAAALVDAEVRSRRTPFRWDRATQAVVREPAARVLFPNMDAGIAEYGLRPFTPFADPRFVGALAREGGVWGFGGRTATFDHLVGDLLPAAVIGRTTKASFNGTRWGEGEREFARSWDGSGISSDWVDAERLRTEWLRDDPHPASDFLLQVAWNAARGGTGSDAEGSSHATVPHGLVARAGER
ncbi:asparagine synthase-related protein [Cellulosimicrobium marinum]|uniref:asparagine synthase-related protein n=1 Tax=Cellulosimicrobium marinum TaxID=1638992 RepID=UPI001E50535F|nr:asparagine synthase-related protein [Cellulosimicrobium marinum]MCB7137059.1 hypothetical protein [Cellulosimicrobium marinum]